MFIFACVFWALFLPIHIVLNGSSGLEGMYWLPALGWLIICWFLNVTIIERLKREYRRRKKHLLSKSPKNTNKLMDSIHGTKNLFWALRHYPPTSAEELISALSKLQPDQIKVLDDKYKKIYMCTGFFKSIDNGTILSFRFFAKKTPQEIESFSKVIPTL